MFGKGKGGIEQSFVDYSKALIGLGYKTTTIIRPKAQIKNILLEENIPFVEFENKGSWDIFATYRLKFFLQEEDASLAICHGNRAINLMRKTGACKVVGVAHNYNIKRFRKLKYAITVTQDLKNELEKRGVPKVFHVPNMINIPQASQPQPFRNPVVIGTLGRFVTKKGFSDFINAIAILKKDSDITVKIAGDGMLKEKLKQQVKRLGLEDTVEFLGWITDKEEFYKSIDIFCLPSLDEPFGIVILEAFAHSIPVVATDVKGACEIINPYKDGIIELKNNPELLAKGLMEFIYDQIKARKIGENGYKTAQENYSFEVVSKKIDDVIRAII